jgi:hypothetical protein
MTLAEARILQTHLIYRKKHNMLIVCLTIFLFVNISDWEIIILGKNPEPRTRNQEPGTRNPEPGTRNPEPGTRNPEPGTRNTEPGTQNHENHIRQTTQPAF